MISSRLHLPHFHETFKYMYVGIKIECTEQRYYAVNHINIHECTAEYNALNVHAMLKLRY